MYLYKNINIIYCNKCNKDLNKYIDLLAFDDQLHCMYCENWITTLFDAFGIREEE